MEIEKRHFADCVLALETRDNEPPKLTGYAARFNLFSDDLGGFKEIIRPGAFVNALAAGNDVRLLINHEGLPLARSASGTLRLSEDDKGLGIVADLDRTDPDVQRVLPKMARRDLTQMSFAFTVAKGGDNWRTEGERTIREINKIERLYDVSLVTFPAYPQTAASVRSQFEAFRREQEKSNVCHAWQTLARMRLVIAEH